MKIDRQETILAIIAEEPVETQEQLIDRLRLRGLPATQATISRDIKQLHLVKEACGGGKYRYTVSAQKTKLNFADRLQVILRESFVSVDYAQEIIVLKTLPGLASAAASAFDGMEISGKIGTLAGDDTVMIIMRSNESARELCKEIGELHK